MFIQSLLSAKKFFLIKVLLFLIVQTQGQGVVKGLIFDEYNTPVSNSQVKLYSKRTQALLSFENTLNKNNFTLFLADSLLTDSLLLKITNPKFAESQLLFFHNYSDTVTIYQIFLKHKKNTSETVTVRAPSVWVRGDTTNYSVKAFNNGTERKLKDVMANLPGFSFDKQGNLLYKGNLVNKILVEGEDLFSEKSQLLLSNFPSHVIDRIQAIENQNSEKIFKGLTSNNQTYVNIKLNKKGLKIAFGDAEVGLGTFKRYLLKSVLFSVITKTKIALITNLNNVGEILPIEEIVKSKSDFGMNNFNYYSINNIDATNYLYNNRKDIKLQINHPINNKTKFTTVNSFNKDDISQEYNSRNAYLSNGIYSVRDENISLSNKPNYFSSENSLLINKSIFRELSFQHKFIYDRSKSAFNLNIDNQTFLDTGLSTMRMNNTVNKFLILFKQRKSENKAVKLTLSFTANRDDYVANSISSAYKSIFNTSFNVDNLKTNFRIASNKYIAGYDLILKRKKQINIFNVTTYRNAIQLRNTSELLLTTSNQLGYGLNELTYEYNLLEERITSSYGNRIVHKKGELLLEGILGVSNIKQKISNNTSSFLRPYMKFAATLAKKLNEKKTLKLITLYNSTNYNLEELSVKPIPSSINNYKVYLYNKLYNNNFIENRLFFSTSNIEKFFFAVTNFNYKVSLISPIISNDIEKIFNFNSIEYSKKTTNEFLVNQNFNFQFKKHRLDIAFGFNYNEFYTKNVFSLVEKANTTTMWYALDYKTNINKKLYFNYTLSQNISGLNVSEQLQNSNISRKNNFTYFKLKNTFVMNKYFAISNSFNLNFYNVNSNNSTNVNIWDVENSFKIFQDKLVLSVRLNNLLNRTNYFDFNNNFNSQTISAIPMIKRNIICMAKFNF
jgi:hypothetical protein